jgi:hypothetical protein
MKHCTTLYVVLDVHKNIITVAHVASHPGADVTYVGPIGKKYGMCPNTVSPNFPPPHRGIGGIRSPLCMLKSPG